MSLWSMILIFMLIHMTVLFYLLSSAKINCNTESEVKFDKSSFL